MRTLTALLRVLALTARGVTPALVCGLISFAYGEGAEPASTGPSYMGVGSCSSSNCHGSVSPRNSSNVLQNEYVTWQKNDRHAVAFAVLQGAQGQRIGHNLGMAHPESEPVCLKCHATYVPNPAQRGNKYRVEDGVGCESCHGPSSEWLASHAETGATHENNLRRGLRALVSGTERTELCSSCHFGDGDKEITHRIMGAGHPRLTFEVDTFSSLEPRHWLVDEDYKKRKEEYSPANAWLNGQLSMALRQLDKLSSSERARAGEGPEFTTLYCYTCHHSLDNEQYKFKEYGGKPGEPTVNLAYLVTLREALLLVNPTLAEELTQKLDGAHSTSLNGPLGGKGFADLREFVLKKVAPDMKGRSISPEMARKILRSLLRYGATHPTLHFEVAEQIAMAASALVSHLDPTGNLYKVETNQLYKSFKTPNEFAFRDFAEDAKRFSEKLAP